MNKLFSVYEVNTTLRVEGYFKIEQDGTLSYLNSDGDWVVYPKGFRIIWNQEQ